jgi:hypothetical protein
MEKHVITKRFSGSAIVLTVLAIAAMTTVALGVAQLVPRDFRQSQALESSLQAENAAWAGVEHALLLLKQAQATNTFVSLSDSPSEPVGTYQSSPTRPNCLTTRTACPGFDRQLGNLQNGKPVVSGDLGTPDTNYSLLIWHKHDGVGNTQTNGLDDGLATTLNQVKDAPNINPVLDRDEVRRLDVAGVTSVAINWKVAWNNQCQFDGGRTKVWLLYSLLDAQGNVIERGFKPASEQQGDTIRPSLIGQAKVLSLRLLATNTTNLDPLSPVNEQKVTGCFIRYNLDTSASQNPAIDLGFDVIESTGTSGGVRRKIRVIVNRENGRLLNILDFGLACQTCSGLD